MRRRGLESHTLVGAYTLDAVSDRDRLLFERHISRCLACAREVAELREATAELAKKAATEPPVMLIERVLQSAQQVRQLTSATVVGARRTDRLPHVRTRDRQVRRSPLRPAGALAVLLLAAVAVLSTFARHAEDEVSAAQQRAHQIAQVLTAPDAVMLTDQVKTGGTATVVLSERDRVLVFTTAGLPRLSASRCYQVWLMGPAGDRSAGMLPLPRGGMTSPLIASGVVAGDRLGLTIEPDGGAAHPTAPLIMVLPL